MTKQQRIDALKENRARFEREVEQCAYCLEVGEMNLHVLDGDDVNDTLAFHDSVCFNAYEKEQGHIESPT